MSRLLYIPKKVKPLVEKYVFLIDQNRDVYLYDIPSKSLTFLFNSVGYGDIASNKIVVGNTSGNGSTEYNYTLEPFSYSINRTWNYGLGNAYCYINENTLIAGVYNTFYKLNMSPSPPAFGDALSLPNSRMSVGDIVYNPTTATYIVSTYISGSPYVYQLVELDSTFNLIKTVTHNYSDVMGLFIYDSILYASNAVYMGNSVYNTNIYTVIDGIFTLYDTLTGKGITGSSQHPERNNVRL